MAGGSLNLRRLDDAVSVAGQIEPDDVATLAALGFGAIINNRPDEEEPDQPRSAEIEAAARAAGLDYRFIPVGGGFSEPQVEATAEALQEAHGPVLAFCRSGTRSTYLWALARSRLGDEADSLVGTAAAAGYDISPIASLLRR
jgi:uncharacterized protein (TIGR01244 family)